MYQAPAPLHAVWGSGPDDVYAVGDEGTVAHRTRDGWSLENAGTTAPLRALWGAGPNDVFAAGMAVTLVRK